MSLSALSDMSASCGVPATEVTLTKLLPVTCFAEISPEKSASSGEEAFICSLTTLLSSSSDIIDASSFAALTLRVAYADMLFDETMYVMEAVYSGRRT